MVDTNDQDGKRQIIAESHCYISLTELLKVSVFLMG